MKKLYTLALVAACAFSATAEFTIPDALLKADASFSLAKRGFPSVTTTPAKAPAKVTDFSTYKWVEVGEGTYAASAMSDTYGLSSAPTIVTIYEAETQAGLYKLVGVWPDVFTDGTGQLIVDATDPDFVTIPVQNTGITDNVDGICYIASKSAIYLENGVTKEEIKSAEPNQVLTLSNNTINLPAGTLYLNYPEAPVGGEYGTEADKWYPGGSKTNGYIKLESPWVSLGMGKFTDNIIYPSFVFENDTPIENTQVDDVEVFTSSVEPGVYKVKDPFQTLYAKLGIEDESPAMYLIATDPNNVLVELASTGIGNSTQGAIAYTSQSFYNLITKEDATVEEAFRIKLTKDGDNRTFTFPYQSVLLIAMQTKQVFYGAQYPSTLTFTESSGIDNIAVEEADGEAVYYNLQGVRVENPTKGIVIRVQGGKATKVLVK